MDEHIRTAFLDLLDRFLITPNIGFGFTFVRKLYAALSDEVMSDEELTLILMDPDFYGLLKAVVSVFGLEPIASESIPADARLAFARALNTVDSKESFLFAALPFMGYVKEKDPVPTTVSCPGCLRPVSASFVKEAVIFECPLCNHFSIH